MARASLAVRRHLDQPTREPSRNTAPREQRAVATCAEYYRRIATCARVLWTSWQSDSVSFTMSLHPRLPTEHAREHDHHTLHSWECQHCTTAPSSQKRSSNADGSSR